MPNLLGPGGGRTRPPALTKNHSAHRFGVSFDAGSSTALEPIKAEDDSSLTDEEKRPLNPSPVRDHRSNSAPLSPKIVEMGGILRNKTADPLSSACNSTANLTNDGPPGGEHSPVKKEADGGLKALVRAASNGHLGSMVVFPRMSRMARRSTILTYSNVQVNYWITDPVARDYIVRLSSVFYALFIIIVGVVLELSNLIAYGTEQVAHLKDLLFAVYMYAIACGIIAFCAVNIYKEHNRLRNIRRAMARMTALNADEPEMLSNPSTGSLYLRVGCVVFGLMGVIYYALMGMMCVFGWEGHTQNECSRSGILISFLAAAFVFMQMWFVYCNGKIAINGKARYFIQFGLMHLVAVNLWLWIRYILYEEAQTIKEIRQAKFDNSSDLLKNFLNFGVEDHNASAHGHGHAHGHVHAACAGVQCIFGEFSEFMYTCVVEYCLICAGIAYVFWTGVKGAEHGKEESLHLPASHRLRKRNIIKIDCSRTAEGLFIGFIFLIASIISVILFNAYSSNTTMAQGIFLSTNMLFYAVAIFVCGYAFWRMKVLAFNNEPEEDDASAELLDEILLVVGLIGELVYCLGGILAFVNNSHKLSISLLLLVLNCLRLLQVTLQSGLLMVGSRLALDIENPKTLRYKPGKQVITLLLIVNLALFFMNIFEAQKAGVTDEVVQLYGSRSWALVVRGCSPLTIFFRFHSSVCFAEIWKRTFKMQRSHSRTLLN